MDITMVAKKPLNRSKKGFEKRSALATVKQKALRNEARRFRWENYVDDEEDGSVMAVAATAPKDPELTEEAEPVQA